MSNSKYRVDERIFMLDCARKYFNPEWVKRLIDEISAVGFNVINIHFTDEVGHRLESKKFPWLAGGDHTLCTFGMEYGCPEDDGKFFTMEEMRDIVRYAQSHGMEVLPSFDSPGHMTYAVKKYYTENGVDIGNYFHKHGKVALVQSSGERCETAQKMFSRGIDISNPEAFAFAKELYTEYGKFFRELGCRSFDIGGDELLGWGNDCIDKTVSKWSNLDHWEECAKARTGKNNAVAYDAFILYMNDIAALLYSLGYESVRMWNDDVYRISDTEWKGAAEINKSIEIQFWSPHTNGGDGTAQFYLDKGHNLYNFARPYTYYTLYPGERAPSYVTPEAIMKEWNPYVFAAKNSECDPGNSTYIFPEFREGNIIEAPNARVKGAGFCLWCDCPSAETEDELLENMRPYFTAITKKACGEG